MISKCHAWIKLRAAHLVLKVFDPVERSIETARK